MKSLKIKTLVIAVSLLISVSSTAQDFHYGLKAGSNFAVQSGIANYFDNNNIRTGLSVGAFGNYSVNNWLSLQTEISYDQKGGKSDDYTNRFDYITVPVLAKFSLGKSDRTSLNFNLNVGHYAGFLLNAESEIEGVTTDVKDNSENLEFGAMAGFGISYPVAKNNTVLDLRIGYFTFQL
ncbi:MAG: PorT family protein [Bacteroidetes bacterium]|nr:PorT family protein [Bacteroidota bacterium]